MIANQEQANSPSRTRVSKMNLNLKCFELCKELRLISLKGRVIRNTLGSPVAVLCYLHSSR